MTEQYESSIETESQEVLFPAEKDFEAGADKKDEKSIQISELSINGYQKLKANDIESAKGFFNRILELDHNNNYALVGLGDSERKQGNYISAIKYYSECLSNHPGNNYALFGLADCYKAQNQYRRAIEIWEEYLNHDNTNITVLTRIADAYRKTHDYKKSKELYLKVLDIENTNAYALIGLGHLNYDFKEYRDALFYWQKAYENNINNVDIRILTSIGNCHRKLKTFNDGLFYFQKALDMDPKNFYALFGMADSYRGLNKQEQSIIYWNKILDIDPENKVILTRLGDAYRNIGDYRNAETYYNRALNIDFDIYAAMGLALICKCEGKYEEATERFKGLIQNDPKNYRLYIDLAHCYLSQNKKNDAVMALESFQKLGIRSSAINELLDKIKAGR